MKIEEYLRKFEPAGPRPELKARVLAGARPRRSWPLLAAAAAILVALWLVNAHAEKGLRETLAEGARAAHVPEPPETQLTFLAELRKDL